LSRIQRVAAYNVCVDEDRRLLICRLSDITERPGWWTLPGGGLEFGEHPEAAALRELHEETGIVGRITELLAVDSVRRDATARFGTEADYHVVRVVYRTEVDHTDVVHETNGSTDRAGWFTFEELTAMPLVEMGELGVRLAFGTRA
jgi:ADP-ribose pyrophosphatase YjhB (NUDIX family)